MKNIININYITGLILIILLMTACDMINTSVPADDGILDGPVEGLTREQGAQFLAGDIAFNNDIFNAATGLGPFFVATSCGSCHAGDGKGHPFTTLTRFGQTNETGNQYIGNGGPQLQNRSIPGYTPEQIPHGTTFSKFTPPANTGLGFLAALTDDQILANADPDDADGDGISGVPNYNTPPDYFKPQWFHKSLDGRYIGRFGKKAAAIDLLIQTVNAYNEDMGITSDFRMDEPSIFNGSVEMPDDVADPEIPAATVRNVVFYLRTLKAPVQRNQNSPEVQAGRQVFMNISCGKCHTPEFTTPKSDIAALSNKTFYPYTDLLMHDMGPELDDNYTEGTAKTYEWRTPPLWGLGLSPKSQGGQYFLMHDGRAKSIEEAILWHSGEAAGSRDKYKALSPAEKSNILKFLESL
ncbi:MAG: di-heme oxidoredictase family protein [Candidatus Kapabacteria bacterium]|nr:di-heme oxidoredictase family protein [Candidatus Kapabacteria bacterium]